MLSPPSIGVAGGVGCAKTAVVENKATNENKILYEFFMFLFFKLPLSSLQGLGVGNYFNTNLTASLFTLKT